MSLADSFTREMLHINWHNSFTPYLVNHTASVFLVWRDRRRMAHCQDKKQDCDNSLQHHVDTSTQQITALQHTSGYCFYSWHFQEIHTISYLLVIFLFLQAFFDSLTTYQYSQDTKWLSVTQGIQRK